MVREYRWQPIVQSGDGDAWGQLPPTGVLRLCEQSAVAAAADAGYGKEFHEKHGSAWVIHRMTLLMYAPAHLGDRLEITTWLSHIARVRGGREYRIQNLTTGWPVADGLAEWVYIDRRKLTPMPIPSALATDFDLPGAPLGAYEAPQVAAYANPVEFTSQRIAEWYETDSMGHVNNAVYANWLDSALREAMEQAGWPVSALRAAGLQLRGEYFAIEYKRAALPGDRLTIATRVEGISDRLCALRQVVSKEDGTELVIAQSVYGWADARGAFAEPPDGWVERGF